MKHMAVFLAILSLAFLNAYGQEKAAAPTKPAGPEKMATSDHLYSEIVIEDFETTAYSDKDIVYTKTGEQQAGISARDEYPAPVQNSKKYLGVKMYGKMGDSITITPPKKLIIEKYCKSISVWAYGKNFSGELSLFLVDADGKNHRIPVGQLNYLGWRKLTVTLKDDVAQQDKYLTQKRVVEITKIIYRPGNTGRVPLWNYFYLDDITAQVREKYTDRQSDDW